MRNRILAVVIIFLIPVLDAIGQATTQIEMADEMMKNGKINVVIAVLSLVFICIVAYLIILDRRITKIEKKQ